MSRLDPLLAWYESLTADTLGELPAFYASTARFKDPFNDVQGVAAIAMIFRHMFDTTQTPRFTIRERLDGEGQAFVTWDFEFGLSGRRHHVHGATRFVFGADGRVIEHRDYWDPTEELWQHLPLLGTPTRWLRRRFRAVVQA